MKRKQNKNYIKVCGKNCKWNKEIITGNIIKNRKKHYCFFTMKICGQNSVCHCYTDDDRKFRFERKEGL